MSSTSGVERVPELLGDARRAALYRSGHLQLIASAGAGKTEVVAQRAAHLLVDGVLPSEIVAFTFTEKAAAELKVRIDRRAAALLGHDILDRIGTMFVGTIHSYAFRLLQERVPRYEVFDVLDDHRLVAFLSREAYLLGVSDLHAKLYRAIAGFGESVQVVENELIPEDRLPQPYRGVFRRYREALENSRLMTYGQVIAHAVGALEVPAVRAAVHASLRHLIVDEYQDINPAQEALISSLVAGGAHLCVVGDDQQAIYQWRGSTVGNILSFADRYPDVRTFRLETNRRSKPGIVAAANAFGTTISQRLPKRMLPHRQGTGAPEVTTWIAATRADEAGALAATIRYAHDELGYRYRDVAILCRVKASFPAILDALAASGIPVQPGGRTALFDQSEAELFGKTICWLVDYEWRTSRYGWNTVRVTDRQLVMSYQAIYELDEAVSKQVGRRLREWKASVADESGPANLVRRFYELLQAAGVDNWDTDDELVISRLGTLSRCSQLLADYESAARRSRWDPALPGEQRGARDRGRTYYEWLARYVQNWARGAYEAFEGEEDVALDAVDLLTVHKAKGLEWPLVFVPALTVGRFPSGRVGEQRNWLLPRRLFDADRYEGDDDDERRLFYVAMTRARDFLSLSGFERIQNACAPSPYLLEVTADDPLVDQPALPPPPEPRADDDERALEVSFSDLAAYDECGLSFRLRRQIGFQPYLVPEIGYGRAVHHVMRHIAELVRATGHTPTEKELDSIFDRHFYLPAANRPAHRQLKDQARRLVDRYLAEWADDLHRIWAVERPFSLHFVDAVISGRADVIIDESDGLERLAIVDYKTAADQHDRHAFQLRIYTDAGRREGLTVEHAYVHGLRGAQRQSIPTGESDVASARIEAGRLLSALRKREFAPRPGLPCQRCDVRLLCRHRAESK